MKKIVDCGGSGHAFAILHILCLCALAATFVRRVSLAEANCAVLGPLPQWELDHCFIRSGTDDEEHPLVKTCVELAPRIDSKSSEEVCTRKRALKTFRCLYLREYGHFVGTQEECLSSQATNGSTVKNGGIGGVLVP